MHSYNTTTIAPVTITSNNRPAYVFVCLLNDGRYLIGQGNNPSKRIACINSGLNDAIPEPRQVKKVIGIKEQTEQRTLPSVVNSFCKRYGLDKVIAV